MSEMYLNVRSWKGTKLTSMSGGPFFGSLFVVELWSFKSLFLSCKERCFFSSFPDPHRTGSRNKEAYLNVTDRVEKRQERKVGSLVVF